MARVLAFVPDLLFGSNVLGALRAAGHEAILVARLGDAAEGSISGADVLVVDLTADAPARVGLVRALGLGPRPRTLAFYSHVESEVRDLAQTAGFDQVIPRSRMAREGGAVVTRLAAEK